MSNGSLPIDNTYAVRHLLAPLQSYLRDPSITEIAIPRPGLLFLRQAGTWVPTELTALTLAYLESLVATLVNFNRLSPSPILSLRFPDGERGNVVMAPAVQEGQISINIRKHASTVRSLADLANQGAFENYRDVSINRPSSKELAAGSCELAEDDLQLLTLKADGNIVTFLSECIRMRRNIVIAGKTGSGKTTFARSLIELVDREERLVTIEDVHELQLPNHPNRVHMLYGSTEGRVSATECLAACMRMSPDRIFLAELRGAEAWEYLNALNTGHPGSVTTTHANSARSTFGRIAMLVKQAEDSQGMELNTILAYLYQTIDVALYFADFGLREIYFDPIHAKRSYQNA